MRGPIPLVDPGDPEGAFGALDGPRASPEDGTDAAPYVERQEPRRHITALAEEADDLLARELRLHTLLDQLATTQRRQGLQEQLAHPGPDDGSGLRRVETRSEDR
jgi:hypothetical protein